MQLFRRISIGIVLILTTILGGCKDENSNSTQTVPTEAKTLSIEHKLGKTLVELSPKTVIVFDYGVLDTLRALNVDVKALPKEPLPQYLSQFLDDRYINVGSLKEPNLEAISRLSPDLIIISGRQAEIYPELAKIGPTLLMQVDDKRYIDSMKDNIKMLGQIFQKEADATKLVNQIDERLNAFKEITENHKNANTSMKTLAMIVTESNLNAFGPGSRFGLIFDELGFSPVDPQLEITNHGQKVSYEYLIEKNPDLIFVLDRGEAIGQSKTAQDIMANKILSNVSAVKNNKIVYLTGEAWYLAAGGYEGFQIVLDDVAKAF